MPKTSFWQKRRSAKAWSSTAPGSKWVRVGPSSGRCSFSQQALSAHRPPCASTEMDELTTTLFEEAHEMVAVEKAKRATAERLYTEAKHKVDVRGERACF